MAQGEVVPPQPLAFQPYLESLLAELRAQEPAVVLGVAVAVVVVILTIVFLHAFLGKKSTRSAVLLIGLCDSGKTLLFSRLLCGKYKRTQTSITESSALYRTKGDRGTAWTLCDLPGHESLRPQYIEKFKLAARAIVFVVDSAIFQKEVRDVAELLYSLLTDTVVVKNAPALLVACNKQDVTMAKSAKLIQQQLEKELNTLRVTRSAALSAQDGSPGGTTVHLGKKGKDFEFSQLPMRMEFVECSARGNKGEEGDADIADLETCLAKLA
ncbi:signal recognition particle receptor subunit beta [Scleropages formosus]|nr:signal recognition particle receptor subunit beta [Scleropages formosus]